MIQATLKMCQESLNKVSSTIASVDKTLTSVKEVNDRFDKFQADFSRALDGIVVKIAD